MLVEHRLKVLDVDALVSEAVQAHENGETMIVQVKISCLNQFLVIFMNFRVAKALVCSGLLEAPYLKLIESLKDKKTKSNKVKKVSTLILLVPYITTYHQLHRSDLKTNSSCMRLVLY